jgi:hypothetical protein
MSDGRSQDVPALDVRRPGWLRVAANYLVVLVSGWGACALSLPEARRPALSLAVLAAVAVVAALVTGWRILGSLAVVLVGATPLMAGVLEEDAASTGRLLLATALVLVLVVGLDGVERRQRGPEPVLLQAPPRLGWWATALVALGSCAVVAAVAAVSIAPSVALVLVGLLAGVGAVLAATRVH